MSYTIGIDIGGTNTDAVLLDKKQAIVASIKTLTSEDITSGLLKALQDLLLQANISPHEIEAIFLGTTHATNALLQKRDLHKVGVIRLAGYFPESLPTCFDWPAELRQEIYVGCETVCGGYECHGAPITPLEIALVQRAIASLLERGAESLAVVGIFSPLNQQQEVEVGQYITDLCGKNFPFSLSHEVGGVGFIERENSTILNAALQKTMTRGFHQLEQSFKSLQLFCPLFLTQNNGSIISLSQALKKPLLTISAGQTNSFIGASRLANLSDALIVDIGGTSTDIGRIQKGFPRRSLHTSHIGGVKLNFPMPDLVSLALGGGSYIDFTHSPPRIYTKSAGREIVKKARCFGGNAFTLTDMALLLGHLQIEGAFLDTTLSASTARTLLQEAIKKIENEISLLEYRKQDLPIILVGGGASLLPKDLLNSRFLIPPYAAFANAYGAALAEISGVVDQIVSLTQKEQVLAHLQEKAIKSAIEKGAAPQNTRIVDIQIIPYHYVPHQMARVMITASGSKLLKCIE